MLNGRYGEVGGLPDGLAPAGWRSDGLTAEDRKAAEDRYHEKLKQFSAAEGKIVAAYWSATVPSGVVMTEQRRQRKLLNLLLGPSLSLHRATTWVTASDPRIAELLHHCDTLGNKAAQILTRTSKRVAMTWIFSTESYLLGIVEGRSWGPILAPSETNGRREPKGADDNSASGTTARTSPAGPTKGSEDSAKGPSRGPTDDELVERGRAEVIEIEKYYDRAAANAARFLLFWGMVFGAFLAGAVAVVIALIAEFGFDSIDLHSLSTRFFFACYTAGGLGAMVSVLTRMRSDNFALDYEVGRTASFWLGAIRPFIGAVFGLFIYFALESELLQLQEPAEGKAFFFFTLLAFVAGFSERLTRVILNNAERTVAGTLDEADKAVGETSTTTENVDGTKTTVVRKPPRKSS